MTKDSYGNCVDITPDLQVYCVANVTSQGPKVGDSVSWTANVTGGTNSYSYAWSGSENLSGSNRTISKVYAFAGTKNASVTVTSGNQTETANCSTYIAEIPVIDVCPNIAGVQTSVPAGKTKDSYGNCVNITAELNVYCEVQPSHVRVGDQVQYRAIATGGNGNYSYAWSGALNGRTGQTENVTFTTTGSKTATVTVSAGNQTDTASCQTVVVEAQPQPNLNVVCDVNDTKIEEGDKVTYKAIVTGGTGSYSYRWNGSDPLDDQTSQTVNVKYTNDGRKTASVTVTSGNQTDSDDCEVVVVEEEEKDENLDVSCEASPSTVYVNQKVTWSVDVDGGSGTKKYEWSGTDDLDGSKSTVSHTYSTPGKKKAEVTVKVRGETESDECSITVLANPVTVYQTPTSGNLASLSSIYLSQVPYTGPADALKYLGYLLSILVVSALGTFYVLKRKAKMSRKDIINAFKQANLAQKGIN
jgi:hypothetical protein